MTYQDIIFPHLHITLHGVGQYISLGSFRIMYYGIIVACGYLLGMLVSRLYAKSIGIDPEVVTDFVIAMIIPSILGARAYYVIFSWDYYKDHLAEIVNLRHGGLGVVGGVLAALVVLIIFCRRRQVKLATMTDIVSMGLLTGQIIGRWGNFFNREAFGGYTDNLFAMQIPVEFFEKAGRMGDLASAGLTDHLVTVSTAAGSMSVIQVHPTFLYESLWNLTLLVIIFLYRKHKAYEGELFTFYMIGYGIGRFLIEGLRTDQLQVGNTGIAATRIVCVFLVLGGIFWEWAGRRSGRAQEDS